ncbi:MAG TPA: hypothetical protein VGR51_06490 [Thermoplasmata archaeon]|jgi:hypothetical protein|nr:hypothetical protein [Thermoplasmata archaeon]
MDRSSAATTLLLWQIAGQADLVLAVGGDEERELRSLVEAVAHTRPWQHPRGRKSPPSIDFLRLDEERDVASLRAQFQQIAPLLRPEERAALEASLTPDVLPESRIAALRSDLERLSGRGLRFSLREEFARILAAAPARPVDKPRTAAPGTRLPRAILLFASDGRLLASEGDIAGVDLPTLSEAIARGEAGSTWRLVQRAGTLVGHLGMRAALVAVFPEKPRATVGGALRVALRSLEERDRLANALTHPGSHTALTAYVHAVRSLLARTA